MLIHLEKLGKSFGEKIVLHDVTASVEREDRIGIVGQNGAGKTTLLKILTGEYQDYEGEFSVTHGVTLGYLEQNAKLDATLDLYGEMRSTFAPVLDAMAQMQVLERKMAAQPDDTELLARHDQLQNIVDAADGYNMDVNIKKVLSGMGFAQDTWQRNIALCIVFSIITFGIYALYWFVCLTNDANQESGQTDATSGGVALLLTIVTCNIYGWFWAYKMGEKIDAIKTKNGQPAGNSSILFLLLQLCGLGIVSYAIMQDTINKNA